TNESLARRRPITQKYAERSCKETLFRGGGEVASACLRHRSSALASQGSSAPTEGIVKNQSSTILFSPAQRGVLHYVRFGDSSGSPTGIGSMTACGGWRRKAALRRSAQYFPSSAFGPNIGNRGFRPILLKNSVSEGVEKNL